MISEIYKKNISIFIFNENVYLARAIKDRLSTENYEVHFYTDENLLRQSVYLALPHIVIVPSPLRYEKLILDVRKMSREIQILVLAPEDDYETVLSLKRKGFINDFIIDPLKYLDSIPYRVDLASERWMLMSQVEDVATALIPGKETRSLDTARLFTTPLPQFDVSQDSILSLILNAESDIKALKVALEQLNAVTGKSFIYLEFDSVREVLIIKDVSFGMKKEFEGLGVPLSGVDKVSSFFAAPSAYKIFNDFLMQVFSASEFHVETLINGDDIFGLFVCLAPTSSMNPSGLSILKESIKALTLKIDSAKKARLIHNYLQIDKDFECYSNKYFYNKISDEISRARRLSGSVSLAIFDVESRDRSAQRHASAIVCKVLKRFSRCTDGVGRVGPFRFGILLSHCSIENGVTKTRKLQAIVKAALEENKISTAIVRAGVTAFPDQYNDAMSLLDAGERACLMADGSEVCLLEMNEEKTSLRDRITDRIKGASL